MHGVRVDKVEHFKTAKEEALRLAWMGISPAVICERVGVSISSVRNWMRDAGLATGKKEAGTFPCPECGDRMQKQELFFWKCPSCSAEWWPPEEVIPDSPDCWNLPIRLDIDPEAHLLIIKLVEEGLEQSEIAKILNQQGYKTPTGKLWTAKTVSNYVIGKELKFEDSWEEEYKQALKHIENLARLGYLHKEIAELLNMWGYRGKRGTPWDESMVQQAFAKKVKKTPKRRKNRLSRAKMPTRMANMIHPWRKSEYARVWSVRRRYNKSEMSSMPGGNDVER